MTLNIRGRVSKGGLEGRGFLTIVIIENGVVFFLTTPAPPKRGVHNPLVNEITPHEALLQRCLVAEI